MNMPKYRAKEIDSDDWVVGFYNNNMFMCMGDIAGHYISHVSLNILEKEYIKQTEIDPSTLAINFPDMLDSENNPIFASLSEDGKGGDLCEHDDDGFTFEANSVVYEKGTICFKSDYSNLLTDYEKLKVIGIQK